MVEKISFAQALQVSALAGFVVSLLIPMFYWLCGFNFNERGPAAFFCVAFSVVAFVAVAWIVFGIIDSQRWIKYNDR